MLEFIVDELRFIRSRVEERREQKERCKLLNHPHDKFLTEMFPRLEKGLISVRDFIKAYSERDARILRLYESFDSHDDYLRYLSELVIGTKRLPNVCDIEVLARHEFEHIRMAAEFGVKARAIFYSFHHSRNYGGRVCTVNFYERGKDRDLKYFKLFWERFVTEVDTQKK